MTVSTDTCESCDARDEATTRVTLSHGELLHLKAFAESVDDPDTVAWWDHLTDKLEKALARIQKRKIA